MAIGRSSRTTVLTFGGRRRSLVAKESMQMFPFTRASSVSMLREA